MCGMRLYVIPVHYSTLYGVSDDVLGVITIHHDTLILSLSLFLRINVSWPLAIVGGRVDPANAVLTDKLEINF